MPVRATPLHLFSIRHASFDVTIALRSDCEVRPTPDASDSGSAESTIRATCRPRDARQRRLCAGARLPLEMDVTVPRRDSGQDICSHGRRCGTRRARRRSGRGHPQDAWHARRYPEPACLHGVHGCIPDRKSTRLNSSHLVISYAVFCLKKKKKERKTIHIDKCKPNKVSI